VGSAASIIAVTQVDGGPYSLTETPRNSIFRVV
jgi:hypothetical protein